MGKGVMSQKFCCEPVSFTCSDFINNCVQNYSTYILRNNQLFCGPQGLLGPKSCSSVTILRARLGAAAGERAGHQMPGVIRHGPHRRLCAWQQALWPQGLQADFLSLEFETVLPLDWSLWRRSTVVIILLWRCEDERSARPGAGVGMEGGKLVDPGPGAEGEGWPWPCLCLTSPTVIFFHFCKMMKIVYILKGVSRVWSCFRWKPDVAGLLRTGFLPVPIHSHVRYPCLLFR